MPFYYLKGKMTEEEFLNIQKKKNLIESIKIGIKMNLNEAVEQIKKESMFPHVKKAVDNALLTNYALIIREAGSGKTRIGTEIIRNNLKESSHVLWICPAGLIEQAHSDLKEQGIVVGEYNKKTLPKGEVIIVSYDMAKSRVKEFTSFSWDLVICDEFHRTRNKGTIVNEATWHIRKKSKKFYALTATPFNNSEEDFFELISLVIGKNVVGKFTNSIKVGKKKGMLFNIVSFFKKTLTGKETKNPTTAKIIWNKRNIEKVISKYVDYLEPEEYMGFLKRPTPIASIVDVQMTEDEVDMYERIYMNKAISNKEMAYRTLLLDTGSSKIKKATEDIATLYNNKNKRILVFSNFVNTGLGSLGKSLNNKGIKHEVYNGSSNKSDKDKIIQDFKDGNIRVLLISPSGFEGLNLKGTTDVFVLDPHYNPSKTTQLIARGLRAGSTIEKVNIKHYCSVTNKLRIPTVDEKIMKTSKKKKEGNDALEKMIKTIKKGKE